MSQQLIGTAPDQVPMNSMLGRLAFMDTVEMPVVPTEVYVQANDPGLAAGKPAIWVQTNVGGDPTKFSLWFNT